MAPVVSALSTGSSPVPTPPQSGPYTSRIETDLFTIDTYNENASGCWIAGFSFGAWIGMQLLMRRPEISGFISVAPPANMHDFSFLAPCPSSGLIVQGDKDEVVPEPSVKKLVDKLSSQRGIAIDSRVVSGAGHFFQDEMEELSGHVDNYLTKSLAADSSKTATG